MSESSRRGVQALAIVIAPLLLAAGVVISNPRNSTREAMQRRYGAGPYPRPVFHHGSWHDSETDERLADDDPRFDFYHDVKAVKDQHDKDLRDNPEKFAPPKFPDKHPPEKATRLVPPKYGD